MTHLYSAYGLTIASEIDCPELQCGAGSPDVVIRYGSTPSRLEHRTDQRVCVDVSPDSCLLRLEQVAGARYLIRDGKEIIIERTGECHPDTLRLFLLSSCLSTVLHQREILPMHGNSVATSRGAIVISGDSGAGKSTLTMTLVQRGYRLLTDDLCPMTFGSDGRPIVQPGIPRLKIWADTLHKFGFRRELNSGQWKRIRPEMDKYEWPVSDSFCRESTPLHKIYLLGTSNADSPSLEELRGLQKLAPLRQQQMGDDYLQAIDRDQLWMTWLANVGRHTQVARLTRPQQGFSADELADLIEQDLQR